MGKILVVIEGGIVIDVVAPEGVTVEIRDYDTEGADPAETLLQDEGGEWYVRSEWEGDV